MRNVVALFIYCLLVGCSVSLKQYGFVVDDAYKTFNYSKHSEDGNLHLLTSCAFNGVTHQGPFFIYPTPFIPVNPGRQLEKQIHHRKLDVYIISNESNLKFQLKTLIKVSGIQYTPISVYTKKMKRCDDLDKLNYGKFALYYSIKTGTIIEELCKSLDDTNKAPRYLTTYSFDKTCGDFDAAHITVINNNNDLIFSEHLKKTTQWGVF